MNSLIFPTTSGSRTPTAPAYYRAAISGGKNIPFPQPGWTNAARTSEPTADCTTSFAIWRIGAANALNYDGSLVSMYYSEYNTGTLKTAGGHGLQSRRHETIILTCCS